MIIAVLLSLPQIAEVTHVPENIERFGENLPANEFVSFLAPVVEKLCSSGGLAAGKEG